MKKLKIFLILIIVFGIYSCEKIPDNLVDSDLSIYSVDELNVPDYFKFSKSDSTITIDITFTNSELIEAVYYSVVLYDGSVSFANMVKIFDDGNIEITHDTMAGDGTFTGIFKFNRQYPSDFYDVIFFVKENNVSGISEKVASKRLFYFNDQTNLPPEISELSMADSVIAGDKMTFSLKAFDPNGRLDIEKVFYELYDPDGIKIKNSQSVSEFPLFDDGDIDNDGDIIAEDGIYTVFLTFPASVKKGIWRFEFLARDKSNQSSNKIVHNIKVK